MEIGAHVSSSGGIHNAVDRAVAIGADSLQLFTQSPRMWRPTNHDPATFERFRERRAETGMGGVLCHALYLCNLAAPNDEVYEKSVTAMRNTMEVACAIGADGVVFHVGSHLGSGFEHGLERAVPALEQVLELCSDETWLLMENSAGTGGTIGRSIEPRPPREHRRRAPRRAARHLPRESAPAASPGGHRDGRPRQPRAGRERGPQGEGDPIPRYRWVILAAGTLAQASFSTASVGLPALAPEIRAHYRLSLSETGVVLAAIGIGMLFTLLPWGLVADRFDERWVIAAGLVGAGAALAGAAVSGGLRSPVAALIAAGALGASVNAASGPAIMAWVPSTEPGLAP